MGISFLIFSTYMRVTFQRWGGDDSLRIQSNLMGMNAHRQLNINNLSGSKSIEKLSSGYRINKAGDDAAGLAISEKMRAQIRGLTQASRNAQDGISMIQTAEGGASAIHDMLQRARELAIHASTETLVDSDRNQVQDEISQIINQIDTVANNTEFNTIKLLNSDGTSFSQSVIDTLNSEVPKYLNDALALLNDATIFGIAYPSSTIPLSIEYTNDAGASYAARMGSSDGSSLTLQINLAQVAPGNVLIPNDALDRLIAHEMMHGMQFTDMATFLSGGLSNEETWVAEGLSMLIQGGNDFLNNVKALPNTDSDYLSANNAAIIGDAWGGGLRDYTEAYLAMRTLHEITDGGIAAFIDRLEAGDNLDAAFSNTTQDNSAEVDPGADFTTFAQFVSWFNTSVDVDTYLDNEDAFSNGTGAIRLGTTQGSDSNLTSDDTVPNLNQTTLLDTYYNVSFANATSAISEAKTFLIGANAGQTISFKTRSLTSSSLGLSGMDYSTRDSANNAISIVDSAIERVSNARSYFGSIQNRLEHTIRNLDQTSENLQAAESRIRDVDMAKEMMSFTKNNILQQAAQAMLAQANTAPQGILQLLR